MDTPRVFRFLEQRQREGIRTALVTVCAVDGSSMRNPGTHMAVSEDGRFAGSLSGGCIENAVVAEAQAALAAGEPRFVRFGAGSPYLDIRLPCGGGLDLHFQPDPAPAIVTGACGAIRARQPFSIVIGDQGIALGPDANEAAFDPGRQTATFRHWPNPRLSIVGHGAGVEALARLARTMHCEIAVLTPDERVERALRDDGFAVKRLSRTSDTQLLASDAWTAIVFLFHDHDWEIALMKTALAMPYFYIGAMGGRKAHAARCESLRAAGASEAAIASMHAPIGLFHSSRDPHTLALSALGEIMLAYQRAPFAERHD